MTSFVVLDDRRVRFFLPNGQATGPLGQVKPPDTFRVFEKGRNTPDRITRIFFTDRRGNKIPGMDFNVARSLRVSRNLVNKGLFVWINGRLVGAVTSS